MPLNLQALLEFWTHARLKLYEKLIGLAGVLKNFLENKVKLPVGGTEVTLLAYG